MLAKRGHPMKLLLTTLLSLMMITATAFGAKQLDEKNITKMLDNVKIAKEHMNIKAMRKHFLSRTSVSITEQNIETSDTKRYTLNEYTRYLKNKWKQVKSNLIEVQDRKFSIDPDGKSALVKTTLVQTLEVNGVKTATTIYETTGIKLIKGKVYINYYSARIMLNTALRVN